MCGITGFYQTKGGQSRSESLAALKAMGARLSHRGPDMDGVYCDPERPFYLGHRRLAIIDLSDDGRQPMESASGRYVICYNGEIYNFQDLMKDLAAQGYAFRGRSDTEVMLAACETWGLNRSLQKMRGMFAFALWDRNEQILHLVRDRLGKKPLYYGWAGSEFVFASELKALHAHPSFKPKINRQALTLYMRYGYVPAPYSIYENVWQLLPGHRLALPIDHLHDHDDVARLAEPYWSHPRIVDDAREKMISDDDADAVAAFEDLLQQCVNERMISDVPLGAFLSGGIDSSAVVALMQKKAGDRPVKTFTIGFEETGFNEAGHAAKVAQHLGTDHHELYLKPQDALTMIPQLPDIYDEPFADVSQIPTCLVAHFARRHVTVALSGDGGDEMLGGYVRHMALPGLEKRTGWMPLSLRKALAQMIMKVPATRWSQLVPSQPDFGEKLYKAAELLPLDRGAAYQRVISQWAEPERLVLGGAEPLIPLTDPGWQPGGATEALSFAESMMYRDALSYLPNDILVKLDRATMACGLEARAPLLDQRMFEFSWRLPEHMKIRDGKGKWLLRQVLARHLPETLFERPKQGFTVPVAEWLRGPLRPWAEELLARSTLKEQGYLDADMVQSIWQAHLQGQGRHAHKLWTILMFQSWLKRWT